MGYTYLLLVPLEQLWYATPFLGLKNELILFISYASVQDKSAKSSTKVSPGTIIIKIYNSMCWLRVFPEVTMIYLTTN